MKVGFILPNGSKVLMNYDDVEEFCKNICLLDENIENFKEFSKVYSYFRPYFDFVMTKLNYVFINPLLIENSYLKSVGKNMYIVETELEDYNYISELAKQKKFSDYDSTITMSSDKNLSINYAISNNEIDTWLIDPNGYSMIAKNNEGYTNHEITANTIVNQLLISSPDLYLSFPSGDYTLMYLVERFGFLRTTSYPGTDFGIIIGFDRMLSDKVLKYKKRILENSNIVYQELETEYANLNDIKKLERLKKIEKPLDYNFSKIDEKERRI